MPSRAAVCCADPIYMTEKETVGKRSKTHREPREEPCSLSGNRAAHGPDTYRFTPT